MAKLTLLMGLPGAGKTTLTNKLKGKKIHIDEVRKVLTGSYRPSKHEDIIYDTVRNTTKYYLENHQDVILDAAFLSKKSRERVIKIAQQTKSTVCVYWLDVSPSLIQERIKKRNEIAEEDRIITMEYIEKLKKLLEPPSDDEGIDEMYYLSDEDLR